MQKEMVASLAERAEQVRGGGVDSSVDNMLKITNDGRKLALDQRMLNDMLPDFEVMIRPPFAPSALAAVTYSCCFNCRIMQ